MSAKQVRRVNKPHFIKSKSLNNIKTYIQVTEITDEVSENAEYLCQKYQMNGQDTYRNR